jgi:serine/threonine protein kinase
MTTFPFMLGQDRYRVERVFADSGGMGLLYEARDTRCADNRVLIKTTRYDGGRHAREFRYTAAEATKHIEATRKILEWEKKVLVRFRNEGFNNIPSANDFFLDRSQTLQPSYDGVSGKFSLSPALLAEEPYLVMEHIAGDVLERRMTDRAWRANMEQHLLTMSRELLTVFIKMHKNFELQGKPACFLYQDLKPANILVYGEDHFTLIDFGGTTLKLGEKTTEPTAGCITTGYAAPEAKGREAFIDARFDLYTLGATLWHIVTQRDPRELGSEFPRLDPDAMRGQGVSDAFVNLVGRALLPDPERRYPTAAAMRKDVMDLLRERVGG